MTDLDQAIADLRTADHNRRHAAYVCADLLARGELRVAHRYAQEYQTHTRQAKAAYDRVIEAAR